MKKIWTWAKRLKGDVLAVAIAIKDPRTPWYAKALGAGIVAYALSPIDLIPDFIPILGMVDDAILIPLGIRMLISLIPDDVMANSRVQAESAEKKRSLAGAIMVLVIWLLVLTALALRFGRRP